MAAHERPREPVEEDPFMMQIMDMEAIINDSLETIKGKG